MTYTIYALFDARESNVVRYIGFSRNFEKRFDAHLDEARKSLARSHRLNWLRKINVDVRCRPLVIVQTADEAADLEIKAIASYRKTGHPLVNGTEGGEGVQGLGGRLSDEALARRNASLNSSAYLIKRSEQSIEHWSSEEAREHQSQEMREHWSSEKAEQHRQIIVEANKRIQTGLKRSPEAREKMRQAKLGKPQMARTEEWKAKISAAQKGIKRRSWTPEEREQRRVRMQDPETRAKMSASAKARVR